ncbi:MATE family efflux transporter [Vibrio jasicida]|uniref:MATE family efflux transporter n=1 Tax=Vibrio jasicida TaxID=766224 RepID=UPI0006AA16C2|nr:MATE family efflux transporter [Vibrio jasicida]
MSFNSTSYAKVQPPIFSADLFKVIVTVAIPVTLQTILFSSKGLIDLVMIGQLTEQNIAAIGVASRALFVVTIFLAGVTAGGAMLTAQYFGAKDQKGVTRSTALTWIMATLASFIPLFAFHFYGDDIIGLSTKSPEIIALGHQYLQVSSWSLLAVAFVGSVAAGLRAMHQAALSTWFSGLGIALNVLFNWVLIFGHLGFPQLGLKGAAIATVLSSMLEVAVIYVFLKVKAHPLRFGTQALKDAVQWRYVRSFFALSTPTTLNFLAWSGGLFAYTAIMGQTGEAGLVVLSVITPIEAFSLSFLTGIANASAVIVGNQLGANKPELAYAQAKGFTVIAIGVTLVVSISLWFLQSSVLDLFTALSAETRRMAEQFYMILCVGILLRSLPTLMVVGVLRAGGDVKFCLYQDLCTQWLFGIPLAALGALVFSFSAPVVFAMFFLETLFKWVACLYRFRSRKWMNCLVKEG